MGLVLSPTYLEHWVISLPPLHCLGEQGMEPPDTCWMFMETKLWMWTQAVGGCLSSKESNVKDKPRSGWPCPAVTPWTEGHLDQLISRLQLGNCVWSWILASMHWKQWWQHWNIAEFVPGGSHKCSHRNRKNTVYKFARTYWTNTRLKVTVSWIASLLVMRPFVMSMSQSQNGSPWSGDMWIPIKEKAQDAVLCG